MSVFLNFNFEHEFETDELDYKIYKVEMSGSYYPNDREGFSPDYVAIDGKASSDGDLQDIGVSWDDITGYAKEAYEEYLEDMGQSLGEEREYARRNREWIEY